MKRQTCQQGKTRGVMGRIGEALIERGYNPNRCSTALCADPYDGLGGRLLSISPTRFGRSKP